MEAKETVLIFLRKDCNICKAFKNEVESSNIKDVFNVDYIDLKLKKHTKKKAKYEIESVPAFAYLDAEGEFVAMHRKAVNFEYFKKLINI